MKPEIKAAIMGILALPLALIFIVWGLMDILSVTGGSTEILIIVPVIVTIIYITVIGVLVVVSIVLKRRDILYKKVHHCSVCGAVIKLEDTICNECGEENAIRYEALKKLEDSEKKIEEALARNEEKRSKKRTTRRENKLEEMGHEMVLNKLTKIRVMKTKLITGDTREGKLEWIKAQYYDLKRTLIEIAGDLGESMIDVRNYLDEIENQDK